MASHLEFVEYVAGQLSEAGEITYRKMFGEYGMYLFIKVTEAGRRLAPQLTLAPPYESAKDYFLFEDIDNREFLVSFVKTTWADLPMPKPKKKKVK